MFKLIGTDNVVPRPALAEEVQPDVWRSRNADAVVVGSMQPLPEGRVEVRFATRRGRDAADDDIAALVAQDADPQTLRVVTSDAPLTAARLLLTKATGVVFRRGLDLLGVSAREAM